MAGNHPLRDDDGDRRLLEHGVDRLGAVRHQDDRHHLDALHLVLQVLRQGGDHRKLPLDAGRRDEDRRKLPLDAEFLFADRRNQGHLYADQPGADPRGAAEPDDQKGSVDGQAAEELGDPTR